MSAHLEKLVREWREAQKAIDRMTPQERKLDLPPLERLRKINIAPLERLVAAHNGMISRLESEARYAKDGRGANNHKNVAAKAKKMRDIRDRVLKASSVEVTTE